MRVGLFSFFLIAFLIRLIFLEKVIYSDGQSITLDGYILENPKVTSGSQVFKLKGIRIVSPRVPQYSYGDRILVSGVITQKGFESNGRHISYFELTSPSIISNPNRNIFIKFVSSLRNRIFEKVRETLPSPEADLLIGIVLGDDSGFDKTTQDQFARTGLMHIVAASGTNVSIVGGAIYLSLLGVIGRRKAIIFSILGIGLYAILSGLSPSIQRAAVMGIITYLALFLGRQTYALWGLGITGFLLILINPYIVFDIGFQLSFMATLGILLLDPLLKKVTLLSKGILKEDFSITLAAYISLFPLLLYHFQTFTPFSLFANILVLWTIPIVTVLGGLGALIILVSNFLAAPVLWVVYPLLHYILIVSKFFSNFFPTFTINQQIPLLFVLGYYFILLSIILKLRR